MRLDELRRRLQDAEQSGNRDEVPAMRAQLRMELWRALTLTRISPIDRALDRIVRMYCSEMDTERFAVMVDTYLQSQKETKQ